MKTIGSRALKNNLGAVLREVRERREEYVVTQHGRVAARIVPEEAPEEKTFDRAAWWRRIDALAAEIGKDWPPGVSAVEAVRDVRRSYAYGDRDADE